LLQVGYGPTEGLGVVDDLLGLTLVERRRGGIGERLVLHEGEAY